LKGRPELIGIDAVDPVLLGQQATLAELVRTIKNLVQKFIDLQPGFDAPARHPDDPV
jgi:hypothetical protein